MDKIGKKHSVIKYKLGFWGDKILAAEKGRFDI